MPCCNTAIYNRLQGVLCRLCSYITNSAKQRTGLYMGVSVDLAHSSVHNTVTTQANYAPTAPHWRAYHQAQHLQHIPDTSVTPGRCTAQHSRPIIIKYIRMQRPRKPGGVSSTDPAQLLRGQRLHLYRVSQAGSRCFPHLALAWHRVSLALAWHCAFFLERRRGTIDVYRRISFRAFAR